jgi:hypothetical protein
MNSVRYRKFKELFCIVAFLAMANFSNAAVVTFEDVNLPAESYWNGSVGSGGFISSDASFNNIYNVDWDSWEGFSCSNITDNVTSGFVGQYNAVAGAGQGGSSNYAICSVGWTEPPKMTLKTPGVVRSLYVTNNNYTYYSMLYGDMFAKKFGGESGNEPDFFLLTITGKDSEGIVTGVVDFYLADFRFDNSNEDYILGTWEFVDLTSLGTVKTLEFALSSSDTGDWGMNTPAYFALDNIEYQLVSVYASPYTESGVNGYIDPNKNWQHARPDDPNSVLNPIFRGWATGYCYYLPADDEWSGPSIFNDPAKALGPVTGDNVGDIVSLGDLDVEEIGQGMQPGRITLTFDDPWSPGDSNAIRNVKGYDFVVFENAFMSMHSTGGGSMSGQMLAELAYVEVSSNGIDFVRFDSVSLTPEPVGPYGTIEIGNVYNLAGKHPNANGVCTGTPFDLQEIAGHPDVVSGLVDINDIKYVRIVDVPGTGDFSDNATMQINPNTWPDLDFYESSHPIYDIWLSWGSGGFDLEAVGVLNEQQLSADIDLNGIVDELDLALLESAWNTHFGQPGWISRCDLAEPKDLYIDESDLEVLNAQWDQTERWRY